jgi:iron complex outermembrane receptor protein
MTHPGLQYMTMVWNKRYTKDSSLKVTWAENYFENIDNSTYDVHTRQDLIEIQNTHNWDPHQVVWGADYTRDVFHTSLVPGGYKSISNPDGFANDQLSTFAEDEIELTSNLWLTIGGRLQHNELTGQDWAGHSVLTWEAVPKHFLRAGVSRAFGRPIMQGYFYWYRSATTSRPQEYPPERYSFDGIDNEHILAYQLGYRGELAENLEVDVETFYHKNSDLIGSYQATVGGYSYRLTDNIIDVSSYGVETSVNYRPVGWWLVRTSHSYEHQTEENFMNSAQCRLKVPSVPKHTVSLTNRFYIDELTTINTQLFYTDAYRLVNTDYYADANKMKRHLRLDLHLARKVFASAGEVAFGVKNANDPYHYEGDSTKIPTQYYVQFRYQF